MLFEIIFRDKTGLYFQRSRNGKQGDYSFGFLILNDHFLLIHVLINILPA